MDNTDVGHRAYMKNLRSLLLEMPKTEIHLHLEALASVDTIWKLMKKHGISHTDIETKGDLQRKFQITSLNEFIDLFINVIQNCFKEESDVDLLIKDAQSYLKRNNIVYAEIFFAPSKFLQTGLDFGKLVEHLDAGVQLLKNSIGADVRFIIDVSRSFGLENAMKNFELTVAHKKPSILGIGLGGAEEVGPARDFEEVFKKAAKTDLHLVAHAGEDVGPESIWDAVKLLGAERIGHGISAFLDEKLMDYLAEHKIPLEICPTSNLFTQKYVTRLEEHPIRQFFDRNMMVTVNTDDPTVFGIDLVDEYMRLANLGFFKPDEIIQLVKNNLYSTFLPEKRKAEIWKESEKIVASYEKELKLAKA